MGMGRDEIWVIGGGLALGGCIVIIVSLILFWKKLKACLAALRNKDVPLDVESQQVERSVRNDPGIVNPGFMPILADVNVHEERIDTGVFVAEQRRKEQVLNRRQEYLRCKKDSFYRKERERQALESSRTRSSGDYIPSLFQIKIHAREDCQVASTSKTYASVASTPAPPPAAATYTRSRTSVLENCTNRIPQSHRLLQPLYHALVIAADATPRMVGAYCMNRNDERIYYYSASTTFLPWYLRNKTRAGCPNEFEMKNLLCALIMWQELIGRYRKVEIYTDNNAVIGRNIYGSRVREFMEHLKGCLDVEIINPSTIYLNRRENPKQFESVLMPADSLSRGRIDKFVLAMANVKPKMELTATPFQSIRQKVELWSKHSCQQCGFGIAYTGSFRPSRTAPRTNKKRVNYNN